MIGRLKSGVPWAQADADVARLSDVLAEQYPTHGQGSARVRCSHRQSCQRMTGHGHAGRRGARRTRRAGAPRGILQRHAVAARAGRDTAPRDARAGVAWREPSSVDGAAPARRPGARTGFGRVRGCALGFGALRAISRYALSLGVGFPPVSFDFRPDLTVGVLACAMVFGVSLGIGLIPAWHAATEGLSADLRRQVSIGGAGRTRVRNALVVVQMTVATVVLVGVGLCLRNVWNLRHVESRVFGAQPGHRRHEPRSPRLHGRHREELLRSPARERLGRAGRGVRFAGGIRALDGHLGARRRP